MGLKKVLQIKEVQKQKKTTWKLSFDDNWYSACPTELTAQPWKVNESGAQQTNGTLRNLKLVELLTVY